MHAREIVTDSVWEAELATTIGEASLILLEQAFGGTYQYIPVIPTKAMIDAVGKEAAHALSDEYHSEDIYVPTQILKKVRNIRITRERNAGKTEEELSAKYRLSIKWIRKIVEEYSSGTR